MDAPDMNGSSRSDVGSPQGMKRHRDAAGESRNAHASHTSRRDDSRPALSEPHARATPCRRRTFPEPHFGLDGAVTRPFEAVVRCFRNLLRAGTGRRRPSMHAAGTALRLCLPLAAALAPCPAGATDPLRLEEVADGVHVYVGPHEEANPLNLGAIGNAAVVVGATSVAVIDTGGSPEFGQRLRASIARLTDRPVAFVITTHAHPDHIFGGVAFDEDGTSFAGHGKLARALAMRSPFYLDAFERLVGSGFEGARVIAPSIEVSGETRVDLGDRVLVLTAHRTAHTDNDLTVLDLRTGTLFAGDLVFVDRLPVVDGSLKGWLDVISELRGVPAARVVPGHGPASAAWPEALDAQERYLRALLRGVRREIAAGGRIETAIERVASEERGRWLAFDQNHPRNVTASFTELEWE